MPAMSDKCCSSSLTKEVELETRLGVAIVSRRQDLLRSCIEEMSGLDNSNIAKLWRTIEKELDVEDILWFKDNLHNSVGKENVSLIDPLTQEERRLKQQIETRVLSFFSSFLERGKDLAILRNQRLYREEYSSWDMYCRVYFNWSKSHADRLIKAAEVVEQLVPVGEDNLLPQSEFVARVLTTIKDKDTRQQVWERSIEIAEDKIVTKEIVQRVKEEVLHISSSSFKTDAIPVFSIGDIVIISDSDTVYFNYWAIIESFSSSNYKVRIADLVIPFLPSELTISTDIDHSICKRVIALANSTHTHIRQLAKTFHYYTTLEKWQYNLLLYLEQLEDNATVIP